MILKPYNRHDKELGRISQFFKLEFSSEEEYMEVRNACIQKLGLPEPTKETVPSYIKEEYFWIDKGKNKNNLYALCIKNREYLQNVIETVEVLVCSPTFISVENAIEKHNWVKTTFPNGGCVYEQYRNSFVCVDKESYLACTLVWK